MADRDLAAGGDHGFSPLDSGPAPGRTLRAAVLVALRFEDDVVLPRVVRELGILKVQEYGQRPSWHGLQTSWPLLDMCSR